MKRSRSAEIKEATSQAKAGMLTAAILSAGKPFAGDIDTIGSRLHYEPNFVSNDVADTWLRDLLDTVKWGQGKVRVFGKSYDEPRLTCYYGEAPYTYSGRTVQPLPWTSAPTLVEIRDKVEKATGERFNTVLCNRYRNGEDTVGWHADNEHVYGSNPTIASVTLGTERDFDLRPGCSGPRELRIKLVHGSLLVMCGSMQEHWQHALPRRKRVQGERVNLTFRRITQ